MSRTYCCLRRVYRRLLGQQGLFGKYVYTALEWYVFCLLFDIKKKQKMPRNDPWTITSGNDPEAGRDYWHQVCRKGKL